MKHDISPVTCLEFEHQCAKSLHWFPYAVRYKLDRAALTLTLEQWQSLSIDTRLDLLHSLLEQGFIQVALRSGASFAGVPKIESEMDEAEAARLLECTGEEALSWLTFSTPFARYALRKRGKIVV